jgi:hypothetical protein
MQIILNYGFGLEVEHIWIKNGQKLSDKYVQQDKQYEQNLIILAVHSNFDQCEDCSINSITHK